MSYTNQEIYTFMAGRDVSASFSDPAHNSEISFNTFKAVLAEVKRVKAALADFASGSHLLTPAVQDEETGEEITPTEYYVPTTNEDLVAQVESDLDVDALRIEAGIDVE